MKTSIILSPIKAAAALRGRPACDQSDLPAACHRNATTHLGNILQSKYRAIYILKAAPIELFKILRLIAHDGMRSH